MSYVVIKCADKPAPSLSYDSMPEKCIYYTCYIRYLRLKQTGFLV